MHSFLWLSNIPSWLIKWHSGKATAHQWWRCRRRGFSPWVRKISWKRKWQPTAAFLLEKSHGEGSLKGCNPQGGKTVRHDLATKQQHSILLYICTASSLPIHLLVSIFWWVCVSGMGGSQLSLSTFYLLSFRKNRISRRVWSWLFSLFQAS